MLTEKTVIDKIEILEDGQIQIRQARRVYDGDELIAEKFHRSVLAPGDDTSKHDIRIQAVTNAIWTADVIKEYQDKQVVPVMIVGK